MLSDLILFYKENLNIVGLVKRKYTKSFYGLIIFYFAFIIFIALLECYCIKIENETKEFIYYMVLILIDMTISFFVVRKLFYWTMLEKDISFVKGKWGLNHNNIKVYFQKELEIYLKSKGLYDNIPTLINLLDKKAKEEKTPFIINSSVFSAMSLIIFASFCNKIYEIIGNDFSVIMIVTVVLLLFSIVTIYVVSTVRELNFKIFTDYISIKNLIDLLEEHQLLKGVKSNELQKRHEL